MIDNSKTRQNRFRTFLLKLLLFPAFAVARAFLFGLNNGYPGVLKNALDYLLPEYKRKPIGIVTVSAGGFGGINCLAQLRLVALGMGAFPILAALPVSRVQDAFDDAGNPLDQSFEKRGGFYRRSIVVCRNYCNSKNKNKPVIINC